MVSTLMPPLPLFSELSVYSLLEPWTPDDTKLLTPIIDNACDPTNYEPNLGLNLEVVDLINTKKGNA